MGAPKQNISRDYHFNDVVVERDNFRVLKRGKIKALEPRAFELLVYLIEHRDRVVAKQELFEQVWKESFVTDNALTQEIKNIRHAIGDAAGSPRYIKTVPKHGYCFVARVEEIASVAARQAHETAKKAASRSAIAVLPFVNLSADPENDYFCDGLAEDLLNALAKIEKLRVVARSSAFSFKGKEKDVREIGRKLNASAVLEGSVRKAGDRLRITTQLINVADGYHLWSERYDRQMEDIFDIQDEIALAIAGALKLRLLGREKKDLLKRHTKNTEAYQLYLKGCYYLPKMTEEDLNRAVGYFRQAIEHEPGYAAAYAQLSNAYGTLAYFGHLSPNETLAKILPALDRAFKLDSTLVQPHLIRAKARFYLERDFAGAERDFKRAIELDIDCAEAHLFYAIYLESKGRFDEAIRETRLGQGLDPFSPQTHLIAGFVFLCAGQFDEAFKLGQELLDMAPSFWGTHWITGMSYLQEGMYQDAIAAFRKSVALGGGSLRSAEIGFVHGVTGQAGEALNLVDEFIRMRRRRYVPAYSIALVYAGLGNADEAFDWLERAIDEHSGPMATLNIDLFFTGLRQDPRFADLLRRIGLAEPSTAHGEGYT
ncbi:MAG TPA: winged helix-turn-helix domain-containing protein [Blastocatellia bacterium]|nr:winged helix-turn-helix domain-containing protein [Blastocatellia bacterium]